MAWWQGKGQGRHRLPAAGGDGEGVQPRHLLFILPLLHTAAQDGTALGIQLIARREPTLRIAIQLVRQHGDGFPTAPLHLAVGHERLRVQEIGVGEAGVEHPGEEIQLQRGLRLQLGRFGQLHLLFPDIIGFQLAAFGLIHPAEVGRLPLVRPASQVRQAAVVSHDAEGYGQIGFALPGACRRVVYLFPTVEKPFLERLGELPDVVEQTRPIA